MTPRTPPLPTNAALVRVEMDPAAYIVGDRIIGGSPLSVYRVTPRGRQRIATALGSACTPTPLVTRLLDAGVLHPTARNRSTDTASLPNRVTVVTPTLGPPMHRPQVPHGVRSLVVDDHSTPAVQHADIRRSDRGGPGAARNTGLTSVNTEIVAFVDADVATTVDPDWLVRCIAYLDAGADVVAPRVRDDVGAPHRSRSGPLDMGHLPGPVGPGRRVPYVPTAVLVCRASAIRAVGGCDEELTTGEDVDLVWRLAYEGYRVRYAPEIVVGHDAQRGIGERLRREMAYGMSAGPLAARHPGRLHPVVASPWSAAALAVVVAPMRRWCRPIASIAVVVAAARRLASGTGLPIGDTTPIVMHATMSTARAVLRAIRMLWWPLLLLGVRRRVVRRALLMALLSAGSGERLARDIAHGIGVWRSSIGARRSDPLVPRIGRRHPGATNGAYAAGP